MYLPVPGFEPTLHEKGCSYFYDPSTMFFDCPKVNPRQSKNMLRISYELLKISGDLTTITQELATI